MYLINIHGPTATVKHSALGAAGVRRVGWSGPQCAALQRTVFWGMSHVTCWLTDSRRLNHKVVTYPASSLAQDRESLLAKTIVLTAMLRRQLSCAFV